MSTIAAITIFVATVTAALASRTYWATTLYAGQCDAALANPKFSNPALGKLDLRDKTFDGEKTEFERYEWYVARLVYVLDGALRLAPYQQWGAVAKTQLSATSITSLPTIMRARAIWAITVIGCASSSSSREPPDAHAQAHR